MSEAYLQQCGELDASRTTFTFTYQRLADNSEVVTGDADAHVDTGLYGAGAYLSRALEQGWWNIEVVYSGLKAAGGTRASFYTMFRVALHTENALLPYYFSYYITPNTTSFHSGTLDATHLLVEQLEGQLPPCARVLFNMFCYFDAPAEGDPIPTVTVTGTFIACFTCPEPI